LDIFELFETLSIKAFRVTLDPEWYSHRSQARSERRKMLRGAWSVERKKRLAKSIDEVFDLMKTSFRDRKMLFCTLRPIHGKYPKQAQTHVPRTKICCVGVVQ